ncbi:hypothetical protein L0F63_000531 [Massospora cicadina]|nr:hypothetical protein L0F63_000531 [Massospora cicadina]
MRYFSCLSLVCCALKVATEKVVVGYYNGYSFLAPNALPYDKVTHINYVFGVSYRDEARHNIFVHFNQHGNKIREIKKYAAAKKVKVLMSVWGWLGSQKFTGVARDAEKRKRFINNMLTFVRKNNRSEEKYPDGWNLDGIDLDLGCPERAEAESNVLTSDDSANYLTLLKELRDTLDGEFSNGSKLLTVAACVKPFDDPDDKNKTIVSGYAKYFDFVNIMPYNNLGSWSKTTGPNTPFEADIAKDSDSYSFIQAIDDWLKAGFPADKLTAGLAFHGRDLITEVDMNKTQKNIYQPIKKSNYSGTYNYDSLREFALRSHNGTYVGYSRYYDNVTQTPWLFQLSKKKFISYEDPQSLQVKVDYAKERKLLGVMCWNMAHDYKDELLDQATKIHNGTSPPIPAYTNIVPTDKPTGANRAR